MDNTTILSKIQNVCRDVFKDENLNILISTSSKDIEQWDSLSNLFLIDAIEKEFNIKFSLDEILNASNIGDLVNYIEQKIRD